MATTDRQNSLLVSQDWQKIYRSFQQSDFLSYDFDTIRRTMIQYLQNNYPEDFNDYIESSEYIALIDLIAYLGQNLSFRTDLNARENFVDTASRRESILKLANMLSYKPARNSTARGLVKLTAIKTSEPVSDSAGNNLSNVEVRWNDPNNPNWFEQFIVVLNASITETNQFGKPTQSQTINSLNNDIYKFKNIKILNSFVWTEETEIEFNLCKKPMVSSVYKPNRKLLDQFSNADRFDIVKKELLQAARNS